MKELWNLLLSAQNSSTGIPQEFLERKKQEIAARKVIPNRSMTILDFLEFYISSIDGKNSR